MKLQRYSKELLWAALPAALVLAALRGGLSNARVLCAHDLGAWFWPEHVWLRDTLLGGASPLWDPYIAFGQPTAGDPVRQILLPTVLLRLVLPEALGFNLIVILPFVVAAFGAYRFFRGHASAPAASLGAAVYALSGPVLLSCPWPNISWQLACVPWALACVDRLARGWSAPAAAALAAIFAFQLVCGELLTLFASAVLAVAYAAVVADSLRTRARAVAATAGFGLVAIPLGAAVVLPSLRAAAQSPRGAGFPASIALANPLHPLSLVESIAPLMFGDPVAAGPASNPWLAATGALTFSVYVGIGAVLLAVAGLSVRRGRRELFWVATLAVALVCAVGPATPIYPLLLRTVPVLTLLRTPVKYTPFAALALAALVAAGWDAIHDGDATTRRRVRPAVAVGLAVGLAALGCALTIVAAPGVAEAAAAAVARAAGIDPSAAASLCDSVLTAAPRVVVLAWAGALCLALSASSHRAARAALFVLVALDLAATNTILDLTLDAAEVGQPAWVAVTRSHPDDRVYVGGHSGLTFAVVGNRPDPDALQSGASSLIELPAMAGRALFDVRTAQTPSAWRLRESISVDATGSLSSRYLDVEARVRLATMEERLRFLRRAGVRYYLLPRPPEPDMKPVATVEPFEPAALYEVAPDVPRASVVPAARVVANEADAIDRLFAVDFDPRAEILLEREPPAPAGAPSPGLEPGARVAADSNTGVTVEASAPDGGGYLLLLDSFDDEWAATVDGAPADVLCANAVFRAVRLAPGRHTVAFDYRPRTFYAGCAVSVATALALALFVTLSRSRALRAWLRPRARPSPRATTP